MNRSRSLLFLGLAVVVALITSVMLFSWLRDVENRRAVHAAPTLQTSGLIVAAADLTWGTKLTREMFQVIDYPAGSLPDGHFTSLDTLHDRVLLVNLKKNEPILESKLAPVGATTGGVAAVTDPNKRAMSVKVDEVIGVAGFIKPADRVDVMVTIEPASGSAGAAKTVAKVILENIKVLAAGTQMERKGKDEEPKPVQVITVEVDVVEAEKLALASTQGRLRLALRNPLNTEQILTRGATVGSLLGSYRPPKKEDPSEVAYKVEIITGNTRKVIKF
ncbi:MAG: Flp pilus assembly protein CpaB [Nitrospiraceae bacterium]